nr:MAG TPA: Tail lysozyme [Caudoviricetes sp.]
MAKSIGILIDPDTGDLQISSERDATGKIAQGLCIGETTYQNQALILQAFKGEFKEYPMLGVGISDLIGDNEQAGWKREIALQLEMDGMAVETVELDIKGKKLIVDAGYDS